MCRKQPGIAIGRLCDKCDGKCPVCDSYVRPTTLVRICDECSFGNYQNKCVVCGGEGISDAFYCFECTRLEKDRDGCPKIINLGSSRTDVSAPVTRDMREILTERSCSIKRKRIVNNNTSPGETRGWVKHEDDTSASRTSRRGAMSCLSCEALAACDHYLQLRDGAQATGTCASFTSEREPCGKVSLSCSCERKTAALLWPLSSYLSASAPFNPKELHGERVGRRCHRWRGEYAPRVRKGQSCALSQGICVLC